MQTLRIACCVGCGRRQVRILGHLTDLVSYLRSHSFAPADTRRFPISFVRLSQFNGDAATHSCAAAGYLRLGLTAQRLFLDDCDAWTSNASLTILNSCRKCSKRQTLGHSAQATSWLQIEGMMRRWRTAHGFAYGSGMASVAEVSPHQFDYRKRGAKLPPHGREEWRKRKLFVCRQNSQRLNKIYSRTWKTATSLKLIRSAATRFCGT